MGYYDDNEYVSQESRSKKERPRRTWITALASAMVGGLIVALLIPGLASLNLLPYDVAPKNAQQQQEATETSASQSSVNQPVQLSVSSGIIDAVEKVSDAIVGVVRFQEQADFFSRGVEEVESGTGSGVVYEIVGDKAHIVTNYHVIEGAQKVEISLPNGERVEATLIGADQLTDLAVLEIDAEHVDIVAEFGDSDTIRAGEPAIAIGNPLGLEFSRTVTQGIISAKERSVTVSNNWELNVIQTDAAINPGNSGGALLNIEGQVIGINSLKIATQGVEGLGFAIPINDVVPIINDLVEHGEVQRPFLGVGIIDLASIDSSHWTTTLNLPEEVNQGIVVRSTETLGPAEQAGIEELDVIVALDGDPVNNSMELRKYLFAQKSIGDTVTVTVYRGGLTQDIDVVLSKSSSN
ncbi:S1C family serine protease [Bacillus horti]|uniref:Serine protease Do n=1 Tax=Caldalkalibacillus horti TaxID=77523 RepID=A0ABT9W2T2_9BACI|nr:trypsin-like peptidase domain-containing protein [Bacillus horti]MDQ0167145.1 serine protease Do [Bacillus horti]